ncbi:MAG: 2TM domain-containing protein [Myxococcales bacterium]|nr:2TM domain-containing protein [Myxococcales bacterium]
MVTNHEQSELTLREVVEERIGSWMGRPPRTTERRLIERWKKRRHSWRTHWHAYLTVIGGLAALNLLFAVATGSLFPWFLFPALGWGMAVAIHSINYRSWVEENRVALSQAAERLGFAFEMPVITRSRPLKPIPKNPRWDVLMTRCNQAMERAEIVLSGLPGNTEVVRERLRDGLERVKKLAAGAKRIQLAVADLSRVDWETDIEVLDTTIENTTDERLRQVQLSNRALLVSRQEKLDALAADEDRMYANAQGFLLALENLVLDGARLGHGDDAEPMALSEPIERLTDEVRVLEEVEAEIRKLPSSTS